MKQFRQGLMVLAGMLLCGNVLAAVVNVNWTGHVSISNVPEFGVGDAASGSFSYATTLSPHSSGPNHTYYDGNITHSFSLGVVSGALADQDLGVWLSTTAQVDVRAPTFDPSNYSGTAITGYAPVQLFWYLLDSSASAIGGLSVPTSLNFADWSSGFARLDALDANGALVTGIASVRLATVVTTVTGGSVPLPSALMLLIAGGLGVFATRRRLN